MRINDSSGGRSVPVRPQTQPVRPPRSSSTTRDTVTPVRPTPFGSASGASAPTRGGSVGSRPATTPYGSAGGAAVPSRGGSVGGRPATTPYGAAGGHAVSTPY